MKQALAIVVRTLLSAARNRAVLALRTQAEIARPPRLDHRLNAGGWN
ncbi:hypothetical protein [Pseudoduganella lutea]|nr:hypothetical protein [Pseudoduganella lutea]